MLRASFVLLFGALANNYQALQKNLRGLVVTLSDDENLSSLLEQSLLCGESIWTASEGVGVEWLSILGERIQNRDSKSSPMLLLEAGEGMGKTALSCKFSDKVRIEMINASGAVDSVRELAPWLPGALVYLGKSKGISSQFAKAIFGAGKPYASWNPFPCPILGLAMKILADIAHHIEVPDLGTGHPFRYSGKAGQLVAKKGSTRSTPQSYEDQCSGRFKRR